MLAQLAEMSALPPLPRAKRRSSPLRWGCALVLCLIAFAALALYWTYGVDAHFATRAGIWWPERGRNLIPPTATDITLRREPLDHYAVYTVEESDLNAFLDERFEHLAWEGETLDSFSERSPVQAGREIGPFGWTAEEGAVSYDFSTRDGAVSVYYHNPTTGRTYQQSAYW